MADQWSKLELPREGEDIISISKLKIKCHTQSIFNT